MKNLYCYLNGKILPFNKAGINPLDIGFSRGYALIEIMRTYNGKIFSFKDHYKRLADGVGVLKLKIPLSRRSLEKVIYQLIKRNHLKEAKIKIILSGGIGKEDLAIGPKPTFFIYVGPMHLYPDKWYQTGVKLITINYQRQHPQLKLSNYVEAIRYHHLLQEKHAAELLYVFNNSVFECSTSNIFMFKGHNLITPNHRVLPGVTRKIILDLAKKRFKTIIRNVTLNELKRADEVFITSTTREILPIVQIDNTKIKNGLVGKKTKLLRQDFRDFIQKTYFK